MAVFMVERSLPGISMEQLGGAQKAAIDTCRDLSSQGEDVRYIRTTFVPEESHCMCLFEASDAALVRRANDQAGLPYTRIVEALDLSPRN